MIQTSFNFPFKDNYLADDFVVSPENAAIFNFVSKYDMSVGSTQPKIFAICGSKHSGKTHLAYIWQKQSQAKFIVRSTLKNLDFVSHIQANQAYIIEDIDLIEDQLSLFHLFNTICEKQAHLLITSSKPLDQIDYQFADIASRFKNIFCLAIKEPDAELIKILLIKNFSTRQLRVENQVIDYIAKNIDRHFTSIYNISKMLEFYCFEKKRKITIPFVSEVIAKV